MKLFKSLLATSSDEYLMGMIKEKNGDAFEEIYNRYSKIILHYLNKMLGGANEQAQDFLHDIFLKIIEKPFLFDQNKSFKTWIFQIAYNKCKNEYRSREIRNNDKTKYELHKIHSIDNKDPLSTVDYQMVSQIINQEISKYKEEHYNTFVLRYQHEMSIKEIAEVCDCPVGTVKSRLFYVTQKVVNNLKQHFKE